MIGINVWCKNELRAKHTTAPAKGLKQTVKRNFYETNSNNFFPFKEQKESFAKNYHQKFDTILANDVK